MRIRKPRYRGKDEGKKRGNAERNERNHECGHVDTINDPVQFPNPKKTSTVIENSARCISVHLSRTLETLFARKMAEQETKNEPGTSKKDFKSPVKDSVLEMRTRMSRLMSIVEITPHNRFPMAAQDPKFQKEAADQNFDYMFKLLIIGNSSVGKTSFLFRYADDSFTSAFVSTVGIDFKVKTVFRHDKRVKLQIWDTAGQERYRTITTAYYRGAMGFILMYDITNEESFNSVQDWVTQIKTYSCDNAQVILVGNKCDMEDERVITTERGKQLADQLGVQFFEASAKENINIKTVFEQLVDIICDKMSESLDNDPTLIAGGMGQAKGQRLTDQPTNPTDDCNC
ncbi:LOW QUALITY PROTEIN: ras-related protein Rab-3-like [Lasioglossum baleicum]|uniref:LOW QUALITY PROTEIN: ras-related protein Rab-3-like n=1 Tax=Lasioglossum baleicum TaxID=434251 RepID=UPI003FCC3E35